MKHYLFMPVPSAEMTQIKDYLVSAFKVINDIDLIVLRNIYDSGYRKGLQRLFYSGCLSNVTSDATLYFLLHGSGEADTSSVGANREMYQVGNKWHDKNLAGIGSDNDENVRGYSRSNNLTEAEYDEKNRKFQEKNLKKYTPKGVAKVLKAEKLPTGFVDLQLLCCGAGLTTAVGDSTAKRVFDELRKLGYLKIKVTGYKGNVETLPNGYPEFDSAFAVSSQDKVLHAPNDLFQQYV